MFIYRILCIFFFFQTAAHESIRLFGSQRGVVSKESFARRIAHQQQRRFAGGVRAELLPLLTQIKEVFELKEMLLPSRFGAVSLLLVFAFVSHGSQWTFRQEQEDASR